MADGWLARVLGPLPSSLELLVGFFFPHFKPLLARHLDIYNLVTRPRGGMKPPSLNVPFREMCDGSTRRTILLYLLPVLVKEGIGPFTTENESGLHWTAQFNRRMDKEIYATRGRHVCSAYIHPLKA